MIFRGRTERALKLQKERHDARQRQSGELIHDDEEFVPERNIKDNIEKGDVFAMILSGLLILVPVALIVLVVLSLMGYLFVVR